AMLLAILNDALDAVEVCDQTVGLLGGFGQYKVLLSGWRDRFYKGVEAVNKFRTSCDDVKAAELENKDDLYDTLGNVSTIMSDFEELMKGYVVERKKQGYRLGITGGL